MLENGKFQRLIFSSFVMKINQTKPKNNRKKINRKEYAERHPILWFVYFGPKQKKRIKYNKNQIMKSINRSEEQLHNQSQ